MAHISAWNTMVWSLRLNLCHLLKPYLHSPAPVLGCADGTCLCTRTGPHCHLSWTCSAIHTYHGTWLWMVCGMPFLEASYQTPSIGRVRVSYPEKGMTVTVTLYQYTVMILKILARDLWWHGHDLKTMQFQHGGATSQTAQNSTCVLLQM